MPHLVAISIDDRDVVNVDNLVEGVHDEFAQIIHVSQPHNGAMADFMNRVRSVMVNKVGIWTMKIKSCKEVDRFSWNQEWLFLGIFLEVIPNKVPNVIFHRSHGVIVVQPTISLMGQPVGDEWHDTIFGVGFPGMGKIVSILDDRDGFLFQDGDGRLQN